MNTNEDQAAAQAHDGNNPNVPQAPTEAQMKAAVSETEGATSENVNNYPEISQRNVRFCGNATFTGPGGSGYAEVKLDDGSTHYTFYSWFRDSFGKTVVAATYQGTSAPAGSGC